MADKLEHPVLGGRGGGESEGEEDGWLAGDGNIM